MARASRTCPDTCRNREPKVVGKTFSAVLTHAQHAILRIWYAARSEASWEPFHYRARSSCVFWGVIIDKMLNWKYHISYVSGKLSRGIGMIMKAKTFLNRKASLTLYYSFVYPYMTYCNHAWGTACVSNLHKIIIIQKIILWIISNADRLASTAPLFEDLGILPCLDVDVFLIGRFMFRYVNWNIPHIFSYYFNRNSDVHK